MDREITNPLDQMRLRVALAKGARDRCEAAGSQWGVTHWSHVVAALERQESAYVGDQRA